MKKITLNKSEMINFVSMIVEEVNLSDYSDEDFLEVFVNLFRPWVKLNHGDEVSKHPMSFLVKKYLDEFVNDYGIEEPKYASGITKITRVGREIVRNGKYNLPSLNSNTKFTERFKKPLDYFINTFNIPDYVKINFTEDSFQNTTGDTFKSVVDRSTFNVKDLFLNNEDKYVCSFIFEHTILVEDNLFSFPNSTGSYP